MQPDIVLTGYGRPASEVLARTVEQARAGRPLAPVTVVVPSNFAGLSARRLLAGSLVPGGIANVDFFTASGLAELLADGQLGGRRPVTSSVLGAAVRGAHADGPHHFRPVRDHHATEQAIVGLVGELANVGSVGLDAIASLGGAPASIIELHREVRSRLGGFHTEADTANVVAHRPDLADAARRLGALIWYLPGALSPPLASMIGALLRVTPATVVVATCGVDAADRDVSRTLRIAGVHTSARGDGIEPASSLVERLAEPGGLTVLVEAAAVDEPVADHVISVSDADEEVRAVVREVVQLMAEGVALDRIGIFHPVPDPYVRILEHHLAAAGLPANGPSPRRLADSIAGRVLLRALELPSAGWRRDRVLTLASGGPVRTDAGQVNAAAWETISRQAGVVGGLGDWRAKLAVHRRRLDDDRVQAAAVGHDRQATELGRLAEALDQLERFIDTLAARLGAVESAAGWSARSAAASELLHSLIGPPHLHRWWPDAEREAYDAVEAALDRLGQLDEIEAEPSRAVFVRALTAELSMPMRRSGRFGHGVLYAPLSAAPGIDLDAVFVLGCTEGLCPAPRREDSLLPDRARRVTRGDLPERLAQIDGQHRLFLAALSAAPAERRWLLLPRGDLRNSRRTRPSRWLLPTASRLASRRLYGTDFEHASPSGVHEISSHAQALLEASHHASVHERDLAEVYAHVLGGGDPLDHPATTPVAAGLVAQRSRRGSALTEYDGNLAGHHHRSRAEAPGPQSPSRLETWAACGFRYFLAHVLGLGDRDDPERIIELSPLDRGSALHLVLERFVRERIDEHPPGPDEPWTVADRERARQIAIEVFDEYEARGRTGRPVLWHTQKRELLAVVDEFLSADDAHRRQAQATPRYLELAFGLDDQPPLVVELDDERSLGFRGRIDRVDVGADGTVHVTDYKTGRGSRYRDLEVGDPTGAGTMLQLGLYAEAVVQLLGTDRVDTRYWMVDTAARYLRLGFPWTSDRRARLVEVLTAIVDGIDGGVFAATPGEWQAHRMTYDRCTYCEFDSVCPTDRAEHAAEKARAPELEVRVALETSSSAVAGAGDGES